MSIPSSNQMFKHWREAKAYETLSIKGNLVDHIPISLDIEAAVVMHEQYEFHPVKFLSGMLQELEKMKVQIFEHSLVTKVKPGTPIILETGEGYEVSCDQAICASHYPVYDPDKYYTDHMNPEISFTTVYKEFNAYGGGMYISYDSPRRTIRLIEDHGEKYLLVGGESHRLGTGTSDQERYERIADFANETFGGTEIMAKWSSHDYLTKDHIPFIGLCHENTPGIYVVTGLNKWGLTNATIGARILADFIDGTKNPFQELFDPYRQIPDIDEMEEESIDHEYQPSTKKKEVEDLKNGEALTYEKEEENFGVYKDDQGKLHYLNISCTHLGCTLGWNDGDQTWDCKCHGSRFTSSGEVIEGPAMKSLEIIEKEEIEEEIK